MPLLKWDDSYSTGIERMDDQHKKWINIINRFYDDLNNVGFKDNTKKLLDDAIEYTHHHFSQEEELMKKMNYPKLAEHHAEHERIKKKLVDFKQALEKGALNVSQPITNELKNWFREHVTALDKEYGDYSKL